MSLSFLNDMDGDRWERLCDSCYRQRYQQENFQKILSVHGGDCGIEGFTKTGIVYQCYFPERGYSDNELHEHLRNKMTKDLGKLVIPTNIQKLKNLGVILIKEWHFVIPYYRDHRILSHANAKRTEILNEKRKNSQHYKHIDDCFDIIVKTGEDMKLEISRAVRSRLIDEKIDFLGIENSLTSWMECESEKVQNIRRKIKAVMNHVPEDDLGYQGVVESYCEAYVKGLGILDKLKTGYPEIYEEIYKLEQAYKRDVAIETNINRDHTINSEILIKISNEFKDQLRKQCSDYISESSIIELSRDLIGGWLADCSMQFKVGD